MADIGAEFTKYLQAYDLEAFYKLCSDKVDDALLYTIFAKHRSQFEAWKKVPEKYKAYGRVSPPEVLERAKQDPNFTSADAEAAKKEAEAKKYPYFLEPPELKDHPAYGDLVSQGFKMTPAEIAAMMLIAKEFAKTGYSLKASEKIAADTALIRMYDKAPKTPENKKKRRALQEERLKNMKDDLAQSQPERAFVRLLRDVKCGRISEAEAMPLLNEHMQNIIRLNRLENLALQMNSPMFTNGGQNSVENKTRMLWENALLYPNDVRIRIKEIRKKLPSSYPKTQMNTTQKNVLNTFVKNQRANGGL